jgi:hypothetical protein
MEKKYETPTADSKRLAGDDSGRVVDGLRVTRR